MDIKWDTKKYYYQKMSKVQQAVYRGMFDGFVSIASEFSVPRMEGKDLADVFFLLRLDYPEIFYAGSFSYRFTDLSQTVVIVPEYMFEKKKIRQHQQALEGRISRLARQAEGMTPEEKEMYIHNFICENVTYDKLKKQYSHEIIGPLQQGVGVCEGIAKTVKVLCDRLHMECIIAISRECPQKGIKYRHAWNLVKIQGKWYHLDATFDNSLGRYGAKRFDYFNLDDKKIFRDHQELVYPVPSCTDGNAFYYKTARLSLTKTEEVGKRLKAVLRKKQPYFVFHWRGGALNKSILEEIFKEASKAAEEKDKYVKLSVNLSQAVLEITILEHQVQAEICMEDADEGETEKTEQ